MHNCDRTCRATVRQLRSAVRIGLLGVPHRQPEERGLRTTEIAELMTRAARRRDGSPRFTIRPIRQKLAGTPPNSRRTPAGNAPRDCLSAAMRLAGGAEFLSRRSGTGFGPSFRRCRGVSIWPSAARLGVFQSNSSAESTKSIKDAVEKAFSCAGDDENSVILAFGSLSFIGALTDAVEEYVG